MPLHHLVFLTVRRNFVTQVWPPHLFLGTLYGAGRLCWCYLSCNWYLSWQDCNQIWSRTLMDSVCRRAAESENQPTCRFRNMFPRIHLTRVFPHGPSGSALLSNRFFSLSSSWPVCLNERSYSFSHWSISPLVWLVFMIIAQHLWWLTHQSNDAFCPNC